MTESTETLTKNASLGLDSPIARGGELPSWWPGSNPYVIDDCRYIMANMPDECVDAIVTDPPFGIGFDYKNDTYTDARCAENYWDEFGPIFRQIKRILKPGGFCAIWQTQLYFPNFWNWFGPRIHIYAGCKNFVQLRKTPINYGYDPIVMFYKGGAEPLRPPKPPRSIDFFVANTAKFVTQKDTPESKHPCPRPIDLTEEIIRNFTLPGGVVLDPFVGSGTTMLACKRNGRIGLGIELNKEYGDLIKERML